MLLPLSDIGVSSLAARRDALALPTFGALILTVTRLAAFTRVRIFAGGDGFLGDNAKPLLCRHARILECSGGGLLADLASLAATALLFLPTISAAHVLFLLLLAGLVLTVRTGLLLLALLLFLDFTILNLASFVATVTNVVLRLASLRLFGRFVVTRVDKLHLALAFLDKLLALHNHGPLLLKLLFLEQPLFLGYLAAEGLAFLFLLTADLSLLLVHAACPCHVILCLTQQVLALPRLGSSLGKVVLHSIPVDTEILEVPVCKAKFVDGREHCSQGGLVVFQALGSQLLQN